MLNYFLQQTRPFFPHVFIKYIGMENCNAAVTWQRWKKPKRVLQEEKTTEHHISIERGRNEARDCVHGVRGEWNNSRAMTASVQRFRFQYRDRSIKKDHACNEAKTKKGTWPEEEPRGRERRQDRRQTSGEWMADAREGIRANALL